MVKTWSVTIPKLTKDEERNAYIYLPTSYESRPDLAYPVLYMFDGHNVFFDSHATYGKSWGLADYLDATGTQLIVVAVECNHSPNHGRLREYSPYTFTDPDLGKIVGKGDLTMKWFVNELKPFIDENYRTLSDRDHTFIAGSSMGGLMSLYAVLKYNRIFSRAAALSPSLWTNIPKIENLIKTAKLNKNTVIYLDYGSEEMDFRSGMCDAMKKTSDMLLERGVYLTCRIIPGGTHCEASWEKQLPFAIPLLMYNLTQS